MGWGVLKGGSNDPPPPRCPAHEHYGCPWFTLSHMPPRHVPLLLPLPGLLQMATPKNGTRVLAITDAPFNY